MSADSEKPINWSENNTINWTDFRAKPELNDLFDAHSKLILSYDAELVNEKLIIKTYSQFDPSKSWVKPTERQVSLLNHERRHFDICEVYRRKFNRALKSMDVSNVDSISDNIKIIFDGVFLQYQKEQRIYDKDTEHSTKSIEQEDWDKRIEGMLKELDYFKDRDTEIIISF